MSGAIESVALGVLTLTAGLLTVISWRAWRETGSTKVLFLAVGFSIFLVKATVLSVSLFWPKAVPDDLLLATVLYDLAILAAFYAAVVMRTRS